MTSNLTPLGDNQLELTPMVRQFIAQKLHNLLDSLEPYVDGTMGPVSARHLTHYLNALKLLGQLYRTFDRAGIVAQEGPVEVGAQELRRQVLGALDQLAER